MTSTQLISGAIESTDTTSTHAVKNNDFAVSGNTTPTFNGMFQNAVHTLQNFDDEATAKVTGLLSGDGTDIHTAMIATQKASLAFEAALAIRNKAVSAYQQIMSMQF